MRKEHPIIGGEDAVGVFQHRRNLDGSRQVRNLPRRFISVVCALAWVIYVSVSPAIAPGSQKPAGKAGDQSAAARDPSSPASTKLTSNEHQIRVRVEVVNVPITVLDKRGLPVIDLSKGEFEVYEDGKRQAIRFFGHEPPLPLRIGLVIDTSNSARRQLPFELDAASEFVFNMLQGRTSKNQIFLQTYDATSSIVQDFTNDPEILNEKIRELKAGGGKALYDAIFSACKERLLKAGNPETVRRVLVLISDGRDVQSAHTFDEAISMAHLAETAIYAIGNSAYGYSNPGDKILEKLSEETGGASFFPLNIAPGTDLGTGYLSHGQIGETSQNKGLGAETGIYSAQRLIHLADSLEAIGRELDAQYYIAYNPSNPALDGTYRTIRIATTRKGVHVRSKPGYFALAEAQ